MSHHLRTVLWGALAVSLAGACLPYTVGQTAQTLPSGETRQTGILYMIPHAVDVIGDSVGAPMRGADVELRRGLDERSDIGLRIPSYSGAVVTYKRRLAGSASPDRSVMSIMAGGGLVNWGEHAEVELTLFASGRQSGAVTPYGGARVMQVAPLSAGAVHDSPTAGGFFGLRIAFDDLEVGPEVGVYWDRSALGLRKANYIIVPGVSLQRRSRRGSPR